MDEIASSPDQVIMSIVFRAWCSYVRIVLQAHSLTS